MTCDGQKIDVWSQKWKQLSPESDIRMWDYFGLRQWILKYTPRFGEILEAGCGLGRYNFYLSKLGINISGLDFSEDTIEYLKEWQKKNGFNINFIKGDVKKLPYADNALSGYLSFGVVEHFIEGPQEPIKEAFRVLRPGGIAIITTPAPSWSKFLKKSTLSLKESITTILGEKYFKILFPNKKYQPKIKKGFFQYEYSPRKLKNYIKDQGFYIGRYSGTDLLYTFTEFGNHTDKYIKENKLGYKISNRFEGSILSCLGAQSVVIAIKTDDMMHCFLCGEKQATRNSLQKFDVPVCNSCETDDNAFYYKKRKKVSFHNKYIISPQVQKVEKKKCAFCKKNYNTDKLFENFGFDKNVCSECLKQSNINVLLSNTSVQPIWRKKELK
ncbi:class I SAM-dependent methyltransferase [Bacteroidota bacterium]